MAIAFSILSFKAIFCLFFSSSKLDAYSYFWLSWFLSSSLFSIARFVKPDT